MFYHVAFATTAADYDAAIEELSRYKRKLAVWIEKNELEWWAQSKFPKDRWGKLNNNPVEGWNN